MAEIKIISRPAAPEDTENTPTPLKVISRPQSSGFIQHYLEDMGRGRDEMGQGYNRMTAPGASPWERAKGAGSAAMGAMSYGLSPLAAAGQAVIGDPAQYIAAKLGVGPQGRDTVNQMAGMGGEMIGPGAVAKGVAEAPGMIQAARELAPQAMPLLNRGASVAGSVFRGGLDAAEDVAGSLRSSALARKANNAAATKARGDAAEKNFKDANDLFEEAKVKGGETSPEMFRSYINGGVKLKGDATGSLRDALKENGVNISDHPTSYPQTTELLKAVDKMAENGSIASFADLIQLQRDARPYLRRAQAAGELNKDASDFRAAQIVKKNLDKLIEEFPDAAGTLGNAKAAYKRGSKIADIQDVLTKSGRIDDPSKVQKYFKDIATDDYAWNNFTPAEQKLVAQLARGTVAQKVGQAAPDLTSIPGAVKASGYAAAGALHPLLSATAGATALGAKALGRVQQRKAVEQLIDMIARGEAAQTAPKGPSAASRIMETLRPSGPLPKRPDYLQ